MGSVRLERLLRKNLRINNMDIKEQVYNLLKEYPETRSSDLILYQSLLWKYYAQYLFMSGDKHCISLGNLSNVPSESKVSRIRRVIQNPNPKKKYNGAFYPTKEIAKKRKWNEEIITIAFMGVEEIDKIEDIAKKFEGTVKGEVRL